MRSKIVVLLHGYTLAALGKPGVLKKDGTPASHPHTDWESVCIGERERPGRIPRALQLARDFDVDNIIFSTGSTWYGGLSEARYIYNRAYPMAMNLGLGADRFKKMATFDEESISTNGTIEIVARWFKEGRFGNEPTYLWHVASANHISRVARDAMKKPFENLPHVTNGFFPAETSYAGGHPSKTDVYDLGDPKI